MARPDFSLTDDARTRLRRWAILIGTLVLLLAIFSSSASLIADYWWYAYDAKAPQVWLVEQKTKLLIFIAAFLVSYALIFINVRAALKAAIVFGNRPNNYLQAVATSALSFAERLSSYAWLLCGVVAFLLSVAATGLWEGWQRFTHSEAFGVSDPIFNNDYSFFVFKLPFLSGVTAWITTAVVTTCAIVIGIYLGISAIASIAKLPLTIPSVRRHLSILGAILLLVLGIGLWLSRYGIGTISAARFTGPGYSELQALGAKTLICYVLWIAAAFALVNVRYWRPYVGLVGGAVTAVALYFFGVLIWPNFVESYTVKPNEIRYQTPYIQRALKATRYAYGLDKIETVDFPFSERPTDTEIAASKTTLDNMRLWDPYILQQSIENLQSLRNYYTFSDIDVDRYTINGKQRMLMIGARDIAVDQLDETRRTWQNVRLQYTHGNGIVAVPVNEATTAGLPNFLLKDIPPTGAAELGVAEPRIYYSDYRTSDGYLSDSYVFVRSQLAEFDYSTEGETQHRWSHNGGVPIGGFFAKLVYSFVFGDKELLLSKDITTETRLLYRRNVVERARHSLPFLQWDSDPYIAVVSGRLLWILDGYTSTDAIPYSAMSTTSQGALNYIRNSVKFTVDAYTGEWHAYEVDAQDPILNAYKRIYPGVIAPASQISSELREHLRYPEDLFTLQSMQLGLYHKTNPSKEALIFYRREDAWQIPLQAQSQQNAAQMSPYYVQMRLPNEKAEAFLLILPFSPQQRSNMIGWLAAHCDPDNYGRLVLYKFPSDKNVLGPAQQEAAFQTDAELSQKITLLSQRGSSLLHGNLLLIPIGRSMMYVKTLFLVSDQQGIRPIPELKLVILAFGNRIVFAESYSRALELLLGSKSAPTTTAGGTEPAASTAAEGALSGSTAQRALGLIEQSKQALRNSDWAKYGQTMKELEDLLRKAAKQ